MQQLSTALSDLVLAITSCGTAASLLRQNAIASAGFLLMGAAAGCGVVRFGRAAPSSTVLQTHRALSWLASVLGMSLVASGFHRRYGHWALSALHLGAALALTAASKATGLLRPAAESRLASGVSAAAVLAVAVSSVLNSNPFGLFGAVVYGLAGAMGTSGEFIGVLRVDWFHYLLAFGNVVFLRAFDYDDPHVFYKDS